MDKKENAGKSNPASPQSCPMRKKYSINEVIYITLFSASAEDQFFFRIGQLRGDEGFDFS